ncbi:restriction endonuclease subunit S [Chryseobacterium vaccae]|uniref:restriction endonuclease subunit S n=1 Tax=Chryseobacterium vaccae TaxID=2604424 RepID=UPI00129778AC|nr:restriction endonuclease subunit S [Chryseobacterium vaccae]
MRFFGFTQDWERKKLGEIGETYSGLSGKTKEDFGTGKPYVQYKQVFDHSKIDTSRFDYVRINESENQNHVKYGDILFTTSSETPEEIGMSSVLLDEIDELYLNSFCFGYRLYSIEMLNPAFGQFLFRSDGFRSIVKILAQGSTRYNLSKNQLMKSEISFPSIEEQRKISDFLSLIDEKILSQSKIIEELETLIKGLSEKLFSQKIRFKKFENKWETQSLGELCKKAKSGGTPKSTIEEYYDGNIPFLAISDMTEQGKYLYSTGKYISNKGIDNSASWIVPIDSIIYSMYASVGFVSINKIELATSQAVLNLIPNNDINIEYLYYYLVYFQKFINKYITTGTQGNLNAETIKNFEVAFPNSLEQNSIAQLLSSIDAKKQIERNLLKIYQFQKNYLLQNLFI